MLNVEKTIADCENKIENLEYTIEKLEAQVDAGKWTYGEEEVDDPRAPRNRYGIGETLYLPVKVTGMFIKDDGSIEYKVECANRKALIGWQIYEDSQKLAYDLSKTKYKYYANMTKASFKTTTYICEDDLTAICQGV